MNAIACVLLFTAAMLTIFTDSYGFAGVLITGGALLITVSALQDSLRKDHERETGGEDE